MSPGTELRRVAFFIPAIERGGVERTLVNVLRGLANEAFSVDLLYIHAREEFLREVPDGVSLVRLGDFDGRQRLLRLLPARIAISLYALPRLLRYLRDVRPHVMLSFQSSVVAVWARQAAFVPTRVIVRESNTASSAALDGDAWLPRLVPLLKRISYPRADAILANSEGARADLARVLRVPPERIEMVHNPTFDPAIEERAREPLEHPWFAQGEPPVILGVGRLAYQKDFGTLLRAFANLRERMPARLVIVGEGHERGSLEELARDLEVAQDVDLPGFDANPYRYMARAAVFALSSRYEGLPNVLIEALTCGTPVVATDCPSGPREILLNGLGGPLVPVGDVEAMSRALFQVLHKTEQARSDLAFARAHLDRFSPDSCVRGYRSLIERLAW